MITNDADVVVVGAGMAGLCCAATLLREGLAPTLVCETPEVGWSLRSITLGEGGRNRGFVQHPIVAADVFGIFDRGERREGADLYACARPLTDAVDLLDAADIHQASGGKQPLLHRRQQVGAAGQNFESAAVLSQEADGFIDGAWAQKFEGG